MAQPLLASQVIHNLTGPFYSRHHAGSAIAAQDGRQLNQLLGELAPRIGHAPLQLIDRLAPLIPSEKLQEAVRIQYPQHVDALTTARDMFQEASHYLETTEEAAPPSMRARISGLFDTMIQVLESFLNAFGIAEFFKPAESDMHADFKGQKIMVLLSLFTMVSAVLLPIVGPALGGMIVGATLLSIAALSLIYPLFKPAPQQLPKGDNWTIRAQRGTLDASDARKETLDEIARTLIAGDSPKLHAMLIGKSGVGKTETVRSFAAAVERGDYPELKGKRVIYFNTADLVNNAELLGNGNRILERIANAMGRHKDQYILIFDEIHTACQETDYATMADQMKTMLDDGENSFPYVIGITTEDDFFRDIYGRHNAFARRFKRIAVESTEDSETMKILTNAYLRQAPKTLLANGALTQVLQKSRDAYGDEAAQPAAAMKLLSLCVQKTADSQRTPLERRVEALREQVIGIRAARAAPQGAALLPYGRENDLAQLERQIHALEEELERQRLEIESLSRNRNMLATVKRAAYTAALQLNPKSSTLEKNRFVILSHYIAPALEAEIRRQAALLHVNVEINDELINQVVAEEQQNINRAEDALDRVRMAAAED